MSNPIRLEDLVLAHQHLYYNGEAVLDDYTYDLLEKSTKLLCPNGEVDSKVGGASRDPKIIKLANELKAGRHGLNNLIPHMIPK